ncbi:MAG: hypothetical protein AAF502_16100 [Bacteroidota bacterium]
MALKFLPSKLPSELSEKEWKDHKSFFQSKTGISAALRESKKQFEKIQEYAEGDYFKLKAALEDFVEFIDETKILISSRHKKISDRMFKLIPSKTVEYMEEMSDEAEDIHEKAVEELERVDKVLGTTFYDLKKNKDIYQAFKSFCDDHKQYKKLKLYAFMEVKLPSMNTIDFRRFYEKYLAKGKPYRRFIPDHIDDFDEHAEKENWNEMPYMDTLKDLDEEFSGEWYPKFLKSAGAYL